MQLLGPRRLGAALLVLAAAVACGPDDDVRPADAALPSYEAPEDAPEFCTRLAGVGGLDRLPVSLGALLGGPDVEARTQVSQVARDLRDVLADVRDQDGPAELDAALDDLVGALGGVADGSRDEPAGADVSAALRQVGALAQPICGFPT
ncbi:hypothetical protein JKP75_03780 [Blastococcus sp. TML/M2B]|uniref:hypothetical protein n=1 Tax=unclassified Blastococcus TaxID=2619396 RepID=UPI00190DE066|nr:MULTISPECIES: hypothetical protein [unclassified Blastococcus]MBN1091769.1 hypothetical protein [Blastococcus sp. TML/M2B]MBN1094675.1 hypothetical protein [Blastococcus sp. TML/C7B]